MPVEWHVERRRQSRQAAREYKKKLKAQPPRERFDSAQRSEMLAAQNSLCAICRAKEARVVDHCHETGKIRGMLCYSCNTAIGALGDTVQGVMRGVRYLEQFMEGSHSPA